MTDDLRTHVAATLAEGLARLQLRAGGQSPASDALAQQAALTRATNGFGASPEASAALLGLIRLPVDQQGDPPAMTPSLGRLLDDAALVAGLVASTRVPVYTPMVQDAPAPRSHRSLGSDLRAVRFSRDSHPYDVLLTALLRADRVDIPRSLRRTLTLLASEPRGRLDAFALVHDLGAWDHDSRWVQKRWAYHFWATAEAGPDHSSKQDKETA